MSCGFKTVENFLGKNLDCNCGNKKYSYKRVITYAGHMHYIASSNRKPSYSNNVDLKMTFLLRF